MPSPVRLSLLIVLLLTGLGMGCERVETLRDNWRPATPRARYEAALAAAGLTATALGKAWHDAAEEALYTPLDAAPPLREVGYLDPREPRAVSYRMALRRGQTLTAAIRPEATPETQLFLDLFVLPDRPGTPPRRVSSADSTGILHYDVGRDQTFLLRLQPELLRGGRYLLTVQTEASLIFPVLGKDPGAIRSFFGADRDGGRRRHHGVDIFAARGTPTLAAVDGYVTRVRNGGLGGKVVWLRGGPRNEYYYYAHLDSQLVRSGTRVQAGDTLGLVGNTGNARTTPPHLHFGIYQNGPHDPFPYLHTPAPAPAVRADTSRLGRWVRVAQREATLHERPDRRSPTTATLPRETTLRVGGGQGQWYRVQLPDGRQGFLDATRLEPAQAPLRQARLTDGRPLRQAPNRIAPAIDSLMAGTEVDVLGAFGSYLHVTHTGRTGWIERRAGGAGTEAR